MMMRDADAEDICHGKLEERDSDRDSESLGESVNEREGMLDFVRFSGRHSGD